MGEIPAYDYDVLVIGSGFGGSVTALRLTEKGYRVGVLESGRRFDESTYAKTSWRLRDFLWAPMLGCKGIQRIHLLRSVVILAGAGVGGGSLNYANTLYEPKSDSFYKDPQWAHISDWRAELAPFYDQAKRMLGVVANPTMTPSDEVMKKVAEKMGVGHTFGMAPVGIFFGREGKKEPGVEVDDPYFGGAGPRRTGCIECGECMTGCRHGAKNTLLKNYLYLAEKNGAEVHPETTVTRVRPLSVRGGYAVDTVRTGAWRSQRTARTFTAEQVVFAAGTWGTQKLLHRMKNEGTLSRISPRLGVLTRTNSESILCATTRHKTTDFTQGVAITSSIHPDEVTHIEPVRYGKGSNSMGLLPTLLTEGDAEKPRWLQFLHKAVTDPAQLWVLRPRRWSERTVILLVMQTLDNSITVFTKRGPSGRQKLTSKQGHGEPNPTWIPAGTEASRIAAEEIGGVPAGTWGELFDIPLTAHFLGGCAIGDSSETGVIDPYHRMYGHPGLHVADGSAVAANLGVNPSLTITAQAERAMAFWPNKGQADPRPPLEASYQRIDYVSPRNPVVPASAPGALRLPIVEVRQGTQVPGS